MNIAHLEQPVKLRFEKALNQFRRAGLLVVFVQYEQGAVVKKNMRL